MEKYNMKEVVNNFIPFKGYIAMTIYKWIFIRKEYQSKMKQSVYTHEAIHYAQYNETFIIGFLLLYVLEYIIKLLCTFSHKRAYKSISFEQEAFKYEGYVAYPKERKAYYWTKYIFKLVNK